MALKIGIDFDRNDWVAVYSSSTDAPNLLGNIGVTAGSLRKQTAGTGGSATVGADLPRYTHERVLYGKNRLNWTTGTTTNCFINIGYDGTFEAGLQSLPAGTYTISLYAKLATGSSSDTFSIVLTNATTTNYAVGTPTALNSSTWTRLTVTGVTPSTQNLCTQLYRITGSTSKVVEIAGVMFVAGATMPTYFNCGTASLLESITSYATETNWELGFKAPHQCMPPIGRATLRLNNDSKRFSPEYSSSPLYPNLTPGLLVQIADPAYGIRWTGWTEAWKPTPGLSGPRDCTVTAVDGRGFLEKPLPYLTLMASATIAAILTEFLNKNNVQFPNGEGTIPTNSNSETVNWDAITTETVPYYGEGNSEDDPAAKLIADMMGGSQSKFWFNRFGQHCYTSGQGDDTPASYVNIGGEWMTAVYGDDLIINDCKASVFRRKASPSTVTLWELDETITLAAGASESFRAYFRNTSNDKILVGAVLASLGITHTASGTNTVSALSLGRAQSALVTFTNNAVGSRDILTASITGTRIVALREIFKQYQDTGSIGTYGLKVESLRFNWVQSRTWAAKLAKYRVERFKNPRKVMTQIKLNAVDMPSEVHQLNIGRAVYVSDDQLSHAGYYAVIGEAHSAKAGMNDHVATFYLEPLYPTTVSATSL